MLSRILKNKDCKVSLLHRLNSIEFFDNKIAFPWSHIPHLGGGATSGIAPTVKMEVAGGGSKRLLL